MKVVFCIAVLIAIAWAERCDPKRVAETCDHTTCTGGYQANCDIARQCICSQPSIDGKSCSGQSDCADCDTHFGSFHTAHCVDGACHCANSIFGGSLTDILGGHGHN